MYIPRTDTSIHGVGWTVKIPKLAPSGHETITARAAKGLSLSTDELEALRKGVRDPDLVPLRPVKSIVWRMAKKHCFPSTQAQHFLRRHPYQSIRKAYEDAIRLLKSLHGKVGKKPINFRMAGRALHLIQDSFSPAHTARDAKQRIIFIRNFSCIGLSKAPKGHGFTDERDKISVSSKSATHAVAASHAYLRLLLVQEGRLRPALGTPGSLEEFIQRFLPLKGSTVPSKKRKPRHGPRPRPAPAPSIRTDPTPGFFYGLRRGDTLFDVARRAFGEGSLSFAKIINNSRFNQRFWGTTPAGERSWFPNGRISFNPRFICDVEAQRQVTGKAPGGRCFATIWIPPKADIEPF